MTKAEITAALARLEKFFAGRRSRQAILAREALERPDPGDAVLREQLRTELAAGLKSDGSVGGAVVPTIWRAIELMDLHLLGRRGHSLESLSSLFRPPLLPEFPGAPPRQAREAVRAPTA